jgi:hypothetical protein
VWSLAATLGAGAGGAGGDRLGTSIALTGTTVGVGAPGFGAGDAGAAFVFERPPGGWTGVLLPRARLEAGEAGAGLGGAVALASSWLVAGSIASDVSALDAGAVDAFRAPAGGWVDQGVEDTRLTAFGFDASSLGAFGAAVAVDEDTLVVGHPGDDHVGSDEGSAIVFLRTQAGDSWKVAARLVASPANPFGGDERFGASVGAASGCRPCLPMCAPEGAYRKHSPVQTLARMPDHLLQRHEATDEFSGPHILHTSSIA